MVFDQLRDHGIKQISMTLTALRAYKFAFRIDDCNCWPGLRPEFSPQDHLTIVDHRMFDLVTHNGITDVPGIFFVVEFCRMDADDDDLIGILFFQKRQIREYVHAVDAAKRPEIQNDNFAFQILHVDGLSRIQPFRSAFQNAFRHGNGLRKRIGGLFLRACRMARTDNHQ